MEFQKKSNRFSDYESEVTIADRRIDDVDRLRKSDSEAHTEDPSQWANGLDSAQCRHES